MTIKHIMTQIEETRSKNAKVDIIKQHIDNEDFVKTFYLAYNPFINFYVKKIPTPTQHLGTLTYKDALAKLAAIYNKEITGTIKRNEYILELLEALSEDDADILRRIIAKNLKCGCSVKSFNKALDIIPVFNCLLAKDYDDTTKKKLKPPFVVQLKSDGSRACAFVKESGITFYTREGNEYLMNVPAIDSQLEKIRLALGKDVMIDGEVVYVDDNGVCDRQKSNGIVNKAIHGTLSPDEEKNIRFYIWDAIFVEDFDNGIDKTPYLERFDRLSVLSDNTLVNDHVEVSPTQVVNTFEEIDAIAEKYILDGEEGAMVKSHDLVWQNKRSDQILKIKDKKECDLLVIGYNDRDQNAVMNQGIGSLICKSKEGELTVSVYGGLSYDDIGYNKVGDDYIFDESFDLDKYNGRIVKVTYNKKILNQKGDGYTLFLPRIHSFRDDKAEPDTIDRIT